MMTFKLDFENELRSMNMDYLLQEGYVPPVDGDNKFEEFELDNKFLYSCLMKTTKTHEAREWLTSK